MRLGLRGTQAQAQATKRRTPASLTSRLAGASRAWLQIRKIAAVHISLGDQDLIVEQILAVAADLSMDLTPGYGDMGLEI